MATGAAPGRASATRWAATPAERGGSGSDETMLDGTDPARRAEELLGEIRRRAAERERPRAERDYLERLLDLF